MTKTVDDLKAMREALVERRLKEAYYVTGPYQDERIEKLAQLQIAIAAIDAVIAEGRDQPDSGVSEWIRSL